MQVTDRSGLEEAGELEINFDPHDQQVTLNYVHIIRDGKVIDRTKDLEFELLQREDELDYGLLTGQITAVSNIHDLRVGDVVDYAITYHVTDTLWPGHYFAYFSTRWSVPLGLRTVRIS